MNDDNFMSNVIGQETLKRKFSIYADSFKQTGVNPFFCFTAPRGYGKTFMINEYVKELTDPQGRERPLIEVNASVIKNIDTFVDIWYAKMRDDNAALFIDECHMLPAKVQAMLLTVCNKSTNPVRRFRYDRRNVGEVPVLFDFREYCMFFATTDIQKLDGALQDRFTKLTIAPYSEEELYLIFEQKLNEMDGELSISAEIKDEIIGVLRGHPRSSFEMAESIMHFAHATGASYINQKVWDNFRHAMGIHDYGLNDTELQIVQIIGTYGAQTLNDLSAKTECTRSALQQEFELMLKKKNLLTIDGKRMLTEKGHSLFRKLFC